MAEPGTLDQIEHVTIAHKKKRNNHHPIKNNSDFFFVRILVLVALSPLVR